MARKLCIDCNIRPQSIQRGVELCDPCDYYAGWENSHSDRGHDDIDTYDLTNTHFKTQAEVDAYIADTKSEMIDCPVCHPELDLRSDTKRTGHTNTVAKTYSSHAGHEHNKTAYDRSLCRKSMAAGHGPYSVIVARVAQREQEIDDSFES